MAKKWAKNYNVPLHSQKGVLANPDGDGDGDGDGDESIQTKGSISKRMAMQVGFESWYISLLSSAKQQREMTKLYVF